MKHKTTVWMVIYADLVTTLMFFFLAAWILARVDRDTQSRVSQAFRMRITGQQYGSDSKDMARFVNNYANEYSKVEITEKRITITLSDGIFFASGSTALTAAVKRSLHDVAELLKKTNNPIVVEGYTDDVPVKKGSNWELSLSRAISVAEYFMNEEGIPRSRFMVAGYGEYKPLVPNTDEESRRKNRRIEITVLRYE